MLRTDLMEFYDIEATLAAFRQDQGSFSALPLPTEETILAAEVMGRALTEMQSAPNLGAVGVVELRSPGKVIFLATASGGGKIPEQIRSAMESGLNQHLGGGLLNIECLAPDTTAVFYAPAHRDTTNFIQVAFPSFHLLAPAHPLDTADLNQAEQHVRALPTEGSFGLQVSGLQLPNMATTITAIKEILAAAVAMRINAFNRTNLVAGQNTLRKLIANLEKSPYGDRVALATNLEALAIPGGNPNQFLFRDDPQKPISTISAIQAPLSNAWRVADLSRFCAEPKAFTYVKGGGAKGNLAGQLAFWWDKSRPNRYKLTDGTTGRYCEYMLPCASCRERSAEMLTGVQVAAPQTQELPTAQPTGVRPRSRSVSS